MTPEIIDQNLTIIPNKGFFDGVPAWECEVRWKGKIAKTFLPPIIGHTRALFYFLHQNKNYLVKIDRHSDFLQCEEEIDIWNAVLGRHRKYFVPILHGSSGKGNGPGWVVVPYVAGLQIKRVEEKHYNTIDRLEHYYKLADMRVNNNWFVVNNRPIIVDYGVRPWM